MTAGRSRLNLPVEEAAEHDQDQAHCHSDDHGDDASVGHQQKILFVDILALLGALTGGNP
jgi:hypothetical protein